MLDGEVGGFEEQASSDPVMLVVAVPWRVAAQHDPCRLGRELVAVIAEVQQFTQVEQGDLALLPPRLFPSGVASRLALQP